MDLPGRTEEDIRFELSVEEADKVGKYYRKYWKVIQATKGITDDEDCKAALAYVTRALQASSHLALVKNCSLLDEDEDDQDLKEIFQDKDNKDIGDSINDELEIGANTTSTDESEDHDMYEQFMDHIRADDNARNLSRVKAFLQLYREIIDNHMNDRVLVFSISIMFLDIIAIALKHEFGDTVKPLRYDGRINGVQQSLVADALAGATAMKPMLISAGTGGLGLNLQAANIVIRLEPWWNKNLEAQADCRAFRSGQTKTVTVYHSVSTSRIDGLIIRTQNKKRQVNNSIMQALEREDDVASTIPEIFSS